ncbi:MAG: SpoIIE family protein phosphatase [Tissierellia bacterium]|nr:SpoIIE family protein phosphatase [Tissierellia bacterium]
MLTGKKINYLEEIKEKYSMLNYHVLESMADWVRVVDYDGRILYANKAMKDSLGSEIEGNKCYQIHNRSKACGFCISKRSIRNKETIQKEEVIDGKFYSIKSSPVLDPNGNAIAAVEVFRDVTRERKLELELIEKNTKMSKDLLFAKRLQRRILPKKGRYNTVKIDHLYKPSEVLSGDMFDIYYIDDEHIGIYISDVVGNGITASMMTMFIRQTMRAIKDDILSPSVALTELHKSFMTLDLKSDKYFTIFYAVYNFKNNHFVYANAGHNCIPIKYNSNEISLLKTSGFPISLVFNEIYYEESEIILNKGDKILFYTDGITEVRNFEGTELGVERLVDTIRNNEKDVLNAIVEDVEKFRWGEQQDDFAMILMEVLV